MNLRMASMDMKAIASSGVPRISIISPTKYGISHIVKKPFRILVIVKNIWPSYESKSTRS